MTTPLPCRTYPIPDNERDRLEALRRFQILDTEPDPTLDRIVKLAARLLNSPVALLTLVDEERVWFKARYGTSLLETSRSWSFSAHSLLGAEPMVVCDATRDERFRENPFVIGEQSLRFFVGAPLFTRSGYSLGSLCVFDRVPRERPSEELLASLADLAFLVVEEFEVRSAANAKRDLKERELRKSIQEKETLLQEVHHRVKNNLQIVSSLLKLQSDSLADPNAKALLRESQQRVLSMALIHGRLSAGKQAAAVEFDSYARALVHELVYSCAGRAAHVTGHTKLPAIYLNIGQAIPCGLILNELVTNALKYAYPNGSGEVTVALDETPDGKIRLAVSDQGQGLPTGFDFQNADSLGLRITHVLAKQLGGILSVESGSRTSFVLEFPKAPCEAL